MPTVALTSAAADVVVALTSSVLPPTASGGDGEGAGRDLLRALARGVTAPRESQRADPAACRAIRERREQKFLRYAVSACAIAWANRAAITYLGRPEYVIFIASALHDRLRVL